MNIHEYQGKSILKEYGVKVPAGIVALNPGEAIEAAKAIQNETGTKFWVVKAQIHAGGRGKGGGIKLAKTLDEVGQFTGQLIGKDLITHQTGPLGKKVHKVLIQQDVYYPGENSIDEFYISILLNRSIGRNVIMYSTQGGMDIEKVAEKTRKKIREEVIDPNAGLMDFQLRRIAFHFKLEGKAHDEMMQFISSLYKAYMGCDASLIEINPVVKTSDNQIMAVDAKIILDDNALYRHKEYELMRDFSEEEQSEIEANRNNLNFIKLEGNIGCMVNGAGLAMATMDIIKLSGGEPANFLDVGGSASAKTVEAGFRIILKDPNVKAVLINIFGGIVRCDRVAEGIIEAYRAIGEIKIPVIVRLQGTNAVPAKELIDKSGLKVLSAVTLQETATQIKEVLSY